MKCEDHDTREVSILADSCQECGAIMYGDTRTHEHDDTRQISILADHCAECESWTYGSHDLQEPVEPIQ